MTINRRLWDLQQDQAAKRGDMLQFKVHSTDELVALRKLCERFFGKADRPHRWPGGPQAFHWGGLLEAGPEEPGVIYMGVYLEPKRLNPGSRRRKLFFRGSKISEFEEQMRAFRATGDT